MDKLQIRRKTFRRLCSFCSLDLLKSVFDSFGRENIEIDESNQCEDVWDVTEYLNNEVIPFIDKMKVLRTFDQLLGIIVYRGKPTQYSVLCSILKRKECYTVLLYWMHTELNGLVPYFNRGDIIVPKVMPKFICRQEIEGTYIIEKLCKGEYVPTEMRFTSKEECESVANNLNEEEYEQPTQ
jgi:hypothetical protein